MKNLREVEDRLKVYGGGIWATGMLFTLGLASRQNELLREAIKKSAVDIVRDRGRLSLTMELTTRLAGIRGEMQPHIEAAQWNNNARQQVMRKEE